MEKGNVLVIGNSGVGKSTLINAVLGEEKAKTGWGTKSTTSKLDIYESEQLPFRLIDTVGFEPSLIKGQMAINAVKSWSKRSAKEGHTDNQINVIWFCVEGTSSKLFDQTIKSLSRATAMWESVPVIVVITKSYSVPDREKNKDMVNSAFEKQKRYSKNFKEPIPVVAETYKLSETAFAAPEGITELIDVTNELMPEGVRAAANDIHKFKIRRKRALAQSVVATSTVAAASVGAVPIPFADAAILAPLEITEINALASIYGIRNNEKSKQLLDSIVEVGTVSAAAKATISGLKCIPGINLGASVLNAVIAGSIAATIGEGSIYVFEKIYTGEKSVEDIEWVKNVIESKFSPQFIEKVTEALKQVADSGNIKEIGTVVFNILQDKTNVKRIK